ncbi:MAG: hypothetical protein WCA46_08270 [Actinocatenispora sp.]
MRQHDPRTSAPPDAITAAEAVTDRTVHALDGHGTVRDWLVGPAWREPVDDLAEHLAPHGDPWGDGRWVLTNGPDVTPLKSRLYRSRPLRPASAADAVRDTPFEGGPVSYLGPTGMVHTGAWRRLHTTADGLVDWSDFCFTPEYRLALAATAFEVDQAEWRTLRLASTGPTQLLVDGELVAECGDVTYMEPAEREVRVWLPSGLSSVVVATWQVAFRECRHVLRLRVGGLPVRVVVPSPGACEYAGAVAERVLDAVGVTRWGATTREVPLTGPDGATLRVSWPGGTQRVRLTDGRATLRLDCGDPTGDGSDGSGAPDDGGDLADEADLGAAGSVLSTGSTVLRVSLDDPRAPVFREFPVAVLPDGYRPSPVGDPATWRAEFLAHAAAQRGSSASELVRALRDPEYLVDDRGLDRALWMIDNRADCADFEAVGLMHLWHRIPAGRWRPGLRDRVRDALLGFKYWIDQPGLDAMCYFTENHQFVWHTAETLVGEAFGDAVFGNSGWTGKEHAEHGRALAVEWLRRKLAGGFSEFDSNAYLAIDTLALVSLVEFAEDEELAELAAGLADRVLFSLAANSWHGIHGAAHGRSYVRTLRSSRLEETAPIMWVCFGVGALNDAVLPATAVATARRYRVPEVLAEVAGDRSERWSGRQSQRGRYRFAHDLLSRPYGSDVAVYKTPDAMLACAQDYRAGLPGLQEHVWGATLGPETQVFVTHAPNASDSSSARPNAWAGNRVLPRARQYEDTVLALYRIPPDDPMGYTHAWFPVAHCDEWTRRGSWLAGRVGDGYVALGTEGGPVPVTSGPDAWQEWRTSGRPAWVCTVGRRATHGTFAEFVGALAEPRFADDSVAVRTAADADLRLDWHGPFTVDGRPVDLAEDGTVADPPQLANPYAWLAFGADTLRIGRGDTAHVVDLRRGRPREAP